MTTFSTKYNVRSISLPTRSHPITIKIEEELNKLKLWQSRSSLNSKQIFNGLLGLEKLYNCIEDFLSSPMTRQSLSRFQHENFVIELIDGSVKYLDICNNARDNILLIKEGVHEFESALRRSKCCKLSIQDNLKIFTCTRKNMKKEMTKSLSMLKHMENKFMASSIPDTDNLYSVIIRVLREVSLTTISVFESLVLFLGVPILKPRPMKWSLVSKLVHKGGGVCDGREENENELVRVDIALNNLLMRNCSVHDEAVNIEFAHKKLVALEVCIEGLENRLDCLFKHLIRTRVSLLNILSN